MPIESLNNEDISGLKGNQDPFLREMGSIIFDNKETYLEYMLNSKSFEEKEYYKGALNGYGQACIDMLNLYIKINAEDGDV